MKSFDSDLNLYIRTIQKSEKTVADQLKTSIDHFSIAASRISNLKI